MDLWGNLVVRGIKLWMEKKLNENSFEDANKPQDIKNTILRDLKWKFCEFIRRT